MRLVKRVWGAVVLVTIVLVAGCATPAPSTALLPSGEFALPTEPPSALPSGSIEICSGVGIDARVHGSAADAHVAWLVSDSGVRVEAWWPAGYRARFSPTLVILDPTGVVVLREGGIVSAACVTGDPGTLFLEPPFTE